LTSRCCGAGAEGGLPDDPAACCPRRAACRRRHPPSAMRSRTRSRFRGFSQLARSSKSSIAHSTPCAHVSLAFGVRCAAPRNSAPASDQHSSAGFHRPAGSIQLWSRPQRPRFQYRGADASHHCPRREPECGTECGAAVDGRGSSRERGVDRRAADDGERERRSCDGQCDLTLSRTRPDSLGSGVPVRGRSWRGCGHGHNFRSCAKDRVPRTLKGARPKRFEFMRHAGIEHSNMSSVCRSVLHSGRCHPVVHRTPPRQQQCLRCRVLFDSLDEAANNSLVAGREHLAGSVFPAKRQPTGASPRR
jgi:hypothetical protein